MKRKTETETTRYETNKLTIDKNTMAFMIQLSVVFLVWWALCQWLYCRLWLWHTQNNAYCYRFVVRALFFPLSVFLSTSRLVFVHVFFYYYYDFVFFCVFKLAHGHQIQCIQYITHFTLHGEMFFVDFSIHTVHCNLMSCFFFSLWVCILQR